MATGFIDKLKNRRFSINLFAGQNGKPRRGLWRSGNGYCFSRVFVCQLADDCDVISGVLAKRNGEEIEVEPMECVLPGAAEVLKKENDKTSVIAIIPKSCYLLRVIDLPEAGEPETLNMLRLETEARVPAEFGEFDVSYQQLASTKEGCKRYETYIVSRKKLAEYLTKLNEKDIQPDYILPSGVVWRKLLEGEQSSGVMVIEVGKRLLEAASIQADDTLSIRRIPTSDCDYGNQPGLVEYIRSRLAGVSAEALPLEVDWIGQSCPAAVNGRVKFDDVTRQCLRVEGDIDKEVSGNLFAHVASLVLLNDRDIESFKTSNLLPHKIIARRERKSTLRSLGIAGVFFLLALICVFASLKVSTGRYQAKSNQLAAQIAGIKTQGEAVGRQLKQLQAVTAARDTRNDYFQIISGLYKGTPGGVTYNHVELNADGVIRLRGQAKSLALPFLLPQKLEEMPMFYDVVLRDAGQTRKGKGSVAEFRIEAKLNRSRESE